MTLATTISRISYTGNGTQDTFAYTWLIYSDNDLKVYVDNILKTKTTHYTVSGVGVAGGGNVVFTAGNIPASGKDVLIYRDQPLIQETDLITNGQIPADTLEKQFDKCVMQAQTIKDTMAQVGKRVAVKVGSSQLIPGVTTTKIALNSEDFDVLNEFDAVTNYRFIPTQAGGYLVVANVEMGFVANAGRQIAYIKQSFNTGATSVFIASEATSMNTGDNGHVSLSAIAQMATSDWLELFVENNAAGNSNILLTVTKMEIARLW